MPDPLRCVVSSLNSGVELKRRQIMENIGNADIEKQDIKNAQAVIAKWNPETWPDETDGGRDWHGEYAERAGIKQHDGRLLRSKAEQEAKEGLRAEAKAFLDQCGVSHKASR